LLCHCMSFMMVVSGDMTVPVESGARDTRIGVISPWSDLQISPESQPLS